jgi:AcrR family transcriptional regulator
LTVGSPAQDRSSSPYGRAEVRDALVRAGIELFAERGPGAVSVREVAAAAGVNHALVFRHFGSKEGLVRAVFEELFERVRRLASEIRIEGDDPVTQGMRVVGATPEMWRLLTYAALEGGDAILRDIPSPFIADALDQLERSQHEGAYNANVDARMLMASGIALALGWAVFQDMLIPLAGLEPASVEERTLRIKGAWDEFIAPRESGPQRS